MSSLCRLFSTSLTLTFFAIAHSEIKAETAEQKLALANLQQGAYLCAPQIAVYNAERQRSWAQRALSHAPWADKKLFVEGGWEDLASKVKTIEGQSLDENDKRILACNAVTGSKIKNHTCVLAPEVTEGPYYHTVGHPVRHNMAELEPGLLFVSPSVRLASRAAMLISPHCV